MIKVLKNYFYTFGYQIFAIIVPLITSPYITRVLGPTNFGISSFVSANIQYFVLFATLGLTTYGQRSIAYVQEDIKKRSKIFWEIELLSIFLNILTTILLIIYSFYIDPTMKVYYWASYALILAVGFDISWYFAGMEKFNVVVLRNFIIKLITIFCIFIFVKSKDDICIYLFIVAISSLIGNVLLWTCLNGELKKINFCNLKPFSHLKGTMSLFIPQIASTIYIVLNKIILGYVCNETQTGYFDNSDKIVKIALTVVTSIATVMMPQVANAFANKDQEKINTLLQKSMSFILFACIPMMFGLIAIANNFSIWFFGKAYGEVGPVMIIESLAIIPIGCSVILTQQFLVPIKKTNIYNKAVMIGAIINVCIGWYLDIKFQARGTSIATLITEIIVTVIELNYIKKFVKIRVLFKDVFKYLVSGLIMFITLWFLNSVMKFNFVTLVILIMSGVSIYLGCLIIFKPNIFYDFKSIYFKIRKKKIE